MGHWRMLAAALIALVATAGANTRAHAQAALLMEEPYGFFGTLNPTGHTAMYFARICADTPIHLRRCHEDESGVVISRYQGIAGYDWVAMPLLPYLYSVENVNEVPSQVDKSTVRRLRDHYHERHLDALGEGVFEGSFIRGGWTQLIGVAFERRIYAFRFATSEQDDDRMIAQLKGHPNRSNFNLIYNNCADFARSILNIYYPGVFKRSIFPDAGMTTPKQITYKMVRYAKKHPEMDLSVYQIPQVPGYRRLSRSNKSVSASLMTTAYAIPITIANPYLAGGLFVDYLVRGRYPLLPGRPDVLTPEHLNSLTSGDVAPQNPGSAGAQATGVPANEAMPSAAGSINSGLKETVAIHEQK